VIFDGLMRNGYRVIAADPPWHFKTRSETRQTRAAKNHYDVMNLDEIKALPVSDLADEDSVLFLWAINPMLPQALEVMKAWGFGFKTVAFTWAKTTPKSSVWLPTYHVGLGYWTRANSEMCLLGTRGRPKRIAYNIRQLIVSPRREHSRKPEEFYDSVERLIDGPRVELFSRRPRDRWECWGNETEKFAA